MKKLILYFFVLVFSIDLLSQTIPTCLQDPTFIDAGQNQTVTCQNPCVNLTVAYQQIKSTTAYSLNNIPFAPVPFGGTSVFLSDDSQTGQIPIGFCFQFYGNTYTNVWIGSNGWVSFSAGQPNTFTSSPIPSVNGNIPKNCIMGPWQDWHPGAGGQIRYQTLGTFPCRRFVVSWTNLPLYSCTFLTGTFQIILYEGTNIIESHILSKPSNCNWAGGTAVHGIHNLAGNAAVVVPGRNSTVWNANSNAYRWTPNGANIIPTITWLANNTVIGNTQTINVCPNQQTTYTAQVTFPLCNNQNYQLQDVVTVNYQNIPVNTSPITHN